MINLVANNEIDGKFFRENIYEMRSEDGLNSLQCVANYKYGKTKKGVYARLTISDAIINEGNYPYFMMFNTLPTDVYAVFIDIDNNCDYSEVLVNEAIANGFKQYKNTKSMITMMKS